MRLHSHDPYRVRDATPPAVPPGAAPKAGDLNVLAWVDRYPPVDNAGGEWALHHMLRPLAAAGHRVDVLARSCPEPTVLEGVRVWPDSLRHVEALAAAADVLVGHLFFTREVVHLAAQRQLPLVYLFHNTFTVEHWNLTPNNLTACVYNACWVRDQVADGGGLTGHPSAVVRPPVALADYEVPEAAHQRTYTTLVNPNPDKGGDVFYDLARRMPGHQFLAVAGAYGQQRRPEPGDRNVVWQHQTAAIRDDVYARTRVVLMPSRYESWGRVAVEAMCSGIPVVAHPTEGLREALGDAALYADRDDVAAWEAALRQLDDPAAYDHWSRAARARAKHLDAQAADDLVTWEQLVRLAAAAESVAGYAPDMTTPAHNPFGAHQDPAEVERPVRAHTADTDPPAPPKDQGNDEVAPDLAADVPPLAADVVAWIEGAADDRERYDRALAAEHVEGQRSDGARKTVQAAIDVVLYPDLVPAEDTEGAADDDAEPDA